MLRRRPLAVLMSSAMILSAVTACNDTGTKTSEVTDTVAVPTVTATSAGPGTDRESGSDVKDAEDGKLIIYGFNSEFTTLAEKYAGISEDDYEFVEVTDLDEYQEKLDAALADGEDAPDIFICDASFAKKYLMSDDTIPLKDIGITDEELDDMFDYYLQFGSCDGSVKGLAWAVAPCGVFYERELAEKYLGTSDPDELALYFSNWDAVKASSRKVSSASGSTVKLFAGFTETYDAYLAARSTGWEANGKINYDAQVTSYYDFAKSLCSSDLTFRAERWSASWKERMSDKSVVTYWGSLDFAKYQLALAPGEGMPVNSTTGDWGVTSAPVGYCDGGTYIMVSKHCDMKATAADIIRAVCIDEENLEELIGNGEFVNNVKLMTQASEDDKFAFEWLGGQNPYAVLLDSCLKADASIATADDELYNRMFLATVGAYSEGAFESVKDAKSAFEKSIEEERTS